MPAWTTSEIVFAFFYGLLFGVFIGFAFAMAFCERSR